MTPSPTLAAGALARIGDAATALRGAQVDPKAKARGLAQDFEAMFLNSMFQHMFTGINGDGPFGGTVGTGVWRSFLSEEYAKSFAKSGGVGLASDVYRSLIAQQEASIK